MNGASTWRARWDRGGRRRPTAPRRHRPRAAVISRRLTCGCWSSPTASSTFALRAPATAGTCISPICRSTAARAWANGVSWGPRRSGCAGAVSMRGATSTPPPGVDVAALRASVRGLALDADASMPATPSRRASASTLTILAVTARAPASDFGLPRMAGRATVAWTSRAPEPPLRPRCMRWPGFRRSRSAVRAFRA